MDCKTAQSLVIPYINDQLDDEELEEFLDHIENCKECYEELEIHFTIHYALQKLDENEKVSFNMPKMLKENLKSAHSRVARRKVLHCASGCVMVVAELLLLLTVLTQLEMLPDKKLEDTRLYQVLDWSVPETEHESETGTETESMSDTKSDLATENTSDTKPTPATESAAGTKTGVTTESTSGAKSGTGAENTSDTKSNTAKSTEKVKAAAPSEEESTGKTPIRTHR